MPLMTIFEPLFLLLALLAVGSLAAAMVLALSGQRDRARRIVRRLAIGIAAYMGVVVAASALESREVYHVGDRRCFDDWCLMVRQAVRDTPSSYLVSLELSNRGKRVPQGEKGTVLYITDASGRRFDPVESTVPFDQKIAAGASIVATRRYAVPAEAHGLSLVYVHEGGFPIGWFIIGENTWVHGPAVVQLD